jgi:hypothetical protein
MAFAKDKLIVIKKHDLARGGAKNEKNRTQKRIEDLIVTAYRRF